MTQPQLQQEDCREGFTVIDHPPMCHPFTGSPYVNVGPRRLNVDACPAYGHQRAIVEEMCAHIEKVVPPRHQTHVYLLDQEEEARTNGASFAHRDYAVKDQAKPPLQAFTFLSAKRIPIHPAMTRYLVAHEYAHHLEDWMQEARSEPVEAWNGAVIKEYAALRGLIGTPGSYGAGTWHLTPEEIFADDFRVSIAVVETEYWPHPGIPRPSELPIERRRALQRWWDEQLSLITTLPVSA